MQVQTAPQVILKSMRHLATFFDGVTCCTNRGESPECNQAIRPRNPSESSSGSDFAYPTPPGDSPDDLFSEWKIVRNGIGREELQRLEQLRKALQDCDQHPACHSQPFSQQPQTLLRFLRAREGNEQKAEKMFRDMLSWRHEFRVEEKVADWLAEVEEQSTPRAVACKRYSADVELCDDRYGIPVRLLRLSVCDAAGAAREFGKEVCLVEALAKMEHTHQEIRKAMFRHKKLLRGQVQVIDIGDYGKHGVPRWPARMWACYQHGPELYRVMDLNYPESVRKVFFIRTGPVANTIWRLVLPLVPPRTKRKLKLYGQRAQEWAAELLAELPRDAEVPRFLLSDSEEAFAEASPKGGIIPEGATSPNFGDPSVPAAALAKVPCEDAPLMQSVKAPCKVRTATGVWPIILAILAVLFTASLGTAARPTENFMP